MAHKTFISYKYDEARELRDQIIKAMGDDATYYTGETSDSPDLSDKTTDTIKKKLKDMIYGTSVTIVIISPNMRKSKWIEWEIEYSLKEIKRDNQHSHSNGIVGIVMNDSSGTTDWLETHSSYADGCKAVYHNPDLLFNIINNNRFNRTPQEYVCKNCRIVDALSGSYISLIDQNNFLHNPSKYIENAFEKSQKLDNYNIHKEK